MYVYKRNDADRKIHNGWSKVATKPAVVWGSPDPTLPQGWKELCSRCKLPNGKVQNYQIQN